MWDETKQQQLNELQRRDAESALTDEEKHLLEQLLYELEQDEWQMLNPALERVRGEQIELQENLGQTETQNAVLSAIASRQGDLLKRADAQLKGLQSEHKALRAERERVLNEFIA
ncbi:MAG: hypothetical protein WKF74_08785 [Pyrinomonadaceae bacterium]